MACLAATAFVASCDTDVESLDINEPGINNQNPQAYANYLADLKLYKKSAHKVAMGWFDNSEKTPFSQGQHIHSVPDSLDYLVLTSPADITEAELKEMDELRQQKGIKIVYEISFEDLKYQYDEEKKAFETANEDPTQTFPMFNNYLVDSVGVKLEFCEKFNFDGIVMAYNGKLKIYMDEYEKAEFIGWENDFIGIAKDWAERHTDKELILMGKPQNIEDKTIFDLAKYLVLPAQSETSASALTYIALKAADEGVPTNKFVALVTTTSLDASDTKTGYWGSKVPAVLGAARWAAASYNDFTPAGIAIENMNNDYYHSTFTYPNVRTAISIINPNAKN